MSIGILAYGSLIEDPGDEIKFLIKDRIKDVETPFKIEFARTSTTRDGAPTLVQYKDGSVVNGQILILKDNISLSEAQDLLWRRETGNVGTGKKYKKVENPTKTEKEKKVIIEIIEGFSGLDTVIYTSIGSNIESITADELSQLAIKSAKGGAGEKGKDGISYLISVKKQGITTPLMNAYEKAILNKMDCATLENTLKKILDKNME